MKIKIGKQETDRHVNKAFINAEYGTKTEVSGNSIIELKYSLLPRTAVDVHGNIYFIWFKKFLKLSVFSSGRWNELENFVADENSFTAK